MLEFLTEFVAYVDSLFSNIVVNLVVAALILLSGFVIGKLLGKLVHRLIHEAEVDKILRKVGIKVSLGVVLGTIISYIIYFVAVMMALKRFGLADKFLWAISIIILVFLVISIILALGDFVPNAFAGVVIHQKEKVCVGDCVKVGSLEGKVVKASLMEVELVTKQKDVIHVPNSVFLKSALVVKRNKKR
jgi:moderate conductance mechanosensitive channel